MRLRLNFKKNKSSPEYIDAQKEKYTKLINSSQSFRDAYDYACKQGDQGLFINYILEIDKFDDAREDLFVEWANEEKLSKKSKLSEFMIELELQSVYHRGGEALGDKIKNLYKNQKISYSDLYVLSEVDINKNNAEILSEIIDLSQNPNYKVGIHRTGMSRSGEEINSQGLNLTGDLSSGRLTTAKNIDLENNISFYEDRKGNNMIGNILRQISVGGSYKNETSDTGVVTIVTIPKKDWAGDVVQESEPGFFIVNPKYIFGYAVVDNKEASITSLVHNQRYLENNYGINLNSAKSEESDSKSKDDVPELE